MLHLKMGLAGLKRVLGSGKGLLIPVAAVALSLPAVAGAAPNVAHNGAHNGAHHGAHDDRGRYDRYEHRHGDRRDSDRHGDWRRDGDHRHGDRHDHVRRDRDKGIDIDIRIGNRRPEYETRPVRVWVPPVYRTVVDRKWVEPVYRTEVERVWVPERVEEREVRYRHKGHWHTRVERVVCEPGHYDTIERRVCVSEGRWETCERQELVHAGHYEYRTERVRAPYRVSPFNVVNPMLGRVGVAGL